MWKLLWSVTLVVLVVGQDVKEVAINQGTKEVANNSSSIASNAKHITNETATLESKSNDKKEEKPAESATVKINKDADPGTNENPFDPEKIATVPDDNAMGNMKYYFALLVVSSLSVISLIVFKALRYVLSVKFWWIGEIHYFFRILDCANPELKSNTELQAGAIEARLSRSVGQNGWKSHLMRMRMKSLTSTSWKTLEPEPIRFNRFDKAERWITVTHRSSTKFAVLQADEMLEMQMNFLLDLKTTSGWQQIVSMSPTSRSPLIIKC